MSYLYTFTNSNTREFYVGIGESLHRPWESHTSRVDALRDAPGTRVQVTAEEFKDRDDLQRAEAIAINIAVAGSLEVLNAMQVVSSRFFVPALPFSEGLVEFSDLRKTAVVIVNLDRIDERPTVHGARSAATLTERAKQWWPIADTVRAGKKEIDHLLMVAKGNGRILGDWKLAPVSAWTTELQTFTFADEAANDSRGFLGQTLRYGGVGIGDAGSYSLDQR